MNKKEKEILCELVASWEWSDSNSNAEAYAFGSAAESIINSMNLSDDDLIADRLFYLGNRLRSEFREIYIGAGWSHDEMVRNRGFHWPPDEDEIGNWACRDAIDNICNEIGYDDLRNKFETDPDKLMIDILNRAEILRDDYE